MAHVPKRDARFITENFTDRTAEKRLSRWKRCFRLPGRRPKVQWLFLNCAGSQCVEKPRRASKEMAENKVTLRDHWLRVSLFLRIVWRIDQSECRMSAKTAWQVAGIVHGQVSAQLDPAIEWWWRINGLIADENQEAR